MTAVACCFSLQLKASSSSSSGSRRGPRKLYAASNGLLSPSRPQDRPQRASDPAASQPRFPLPLPGWLKREAEPTTPPEVQPSIFTDKQPTLAFAGGGIFFWWELGALRYLNQNFDLGKVLLVGASAGGLMATLAACGVDEDRALRVANRLAEEYGVFRRPAGLAGIWGSLIRRWLEELLPEDAAELCAGRVRLVVTEVPSLKLRYLENFENKEDLINANMASVHIPIFLDGKPTCSYRGRSYIDGSLWDFLLSDNSDLIKCEGSACIIDYFEDDQLQWGRLDFIKLASLDEVRGLVETGYAYAQRTDATTDLFERTLGPTRKGTVRKVLEKPVWSLRRVLSAVVT